MEAMFAPVVFVWKIRQLWSTVAAPVRSVQRASFAAPDETWTIRHVSGDVAEPPVDGVHWNWLTLMAYESWTTCLDFVHVQPTPGHVGPA
jgi:hypothetical protein